jgi:glucose/mannose-6-phosphate isomerase
MSFDPDVLDDEGLLVRRDEGRLLWSLAGSGAHIRRAVNVGAETDFARLSSEDRPRAVLLVGDATCRPALRILARLLLAGAPTIVWNGAELPRWAGPADALIAASLDGHQPRVASIVSDAGRRGLALCVLAPPDSPVAAVAGRAPVAHLDPEAHSRASLWAVLTPMLQAADALGVFSLADARLDEIADGLDLVAETCRPTSPTFTNPAKGLALDLAEATGLIVGAGPLAAVAARLVADGLRLVAGAPAISVSLPDGMPTAVALLSARGAPDPDDFFRDRSEDTSPRPPRLVMIGDDGDPDDPSLGPQSGAQFQLEERAARRAASDLHRLAASVGARSSTVDVPTGAPLTRMAAAVSFGLFTATYLALAQGIDPSGEEVRS